jgi:hypothetical protein
MYRAKHLVKYRTLFQIWNQTLLSSRWTVHPSFKVKAFSTETGFQRDAKTVNWQSRVDLAAAFRGFEMMNFHEGICNHLSLMAPAASGNGKVTLTLPYGYHWKEVNLIVLFILFITLRH